jgi:catechol 2,3-dioxygenase-like lactoylglutathione lyase family enzyme
MPNRPTAGSAPLAVHAVDHVAYTVPDLPQAVDFFVNVLGAQIRYQRRSDALGPDTSECFNVNPGASLRLAKLELAGTLLELFEYRDTGSPTESIGNSACGGGHLGLLVDDFDAAVERMRETPGVRVLGKPSVLPADHPLAGRRWVYFLTPWGLQLELVSPVP